MKTGFKDIDNNIKINNGELIVIASRPFIGKTTFALNILSHIALGEKKGALLFSLEDGEKNITEKLIISNSMVEKEKFDLYNQYKETKIKKPELLEDDWDRIAYGIEILKDAPIYLSCDAPLSIDDIYEKSKKMKLEKNIDVIIIDYLQLIKFDKKKLLSRDDEITEILRQLKVLAKELNIPVIVTSQLSRPTKERNNSKPVIEDFSSSKYGITKYSDKILFLYRHLDYTENRKSNIAELIIAKNNDGNINTIKLGWLPEYCKFGNAIVFEKNKNGK